MSRFQQFLFLPLNIPIISLETSLLSIGKNCPHFYSYFHYIHTSVLSFSTWFDIDKLGSKLLQIWQNNIKCSKKGQGILFTSYVEVSLRSWNTGRYAVPTAKPMQITVTVEYRYWVPYKYISVGTPNRVIPEMKLKTNCIHQNIYL
jgi:hypothetical protein